MTNLKALIRRHPVLTYYALTLAISWGGILLVIGEPGGGEEALGVPTVRGTVLLV